MGEHNCYRKDETGCIQRKAYELWEKDGCKDGRDSEYWLLAEKTVRGNAKPKDQKTEQKTKEPNNV